MSWPILPFKFSCFLFYRSQFIHKTLEENNEYIEDNQLCSEWYDSITCKILSRNFKIFSGLDNVMDVLSCEWGWWGIVRICLRKTWNKFTVLNKIGYIILGKFWYLVLYSTWLLSATTMPMAWRSCELAGLLYLSMHTYRVFSSLSFVD